MSFNWEGFTVQYPVKVKDDVKFHMHAKRINLFIVLYFHRVFYCRVLPTEWYILYEYTRSQNLN